MNETMTRFGYPESLIRESDHWVVLLRPKQVTLGALVLVHTGEAKEFSDIPPAAFAELHDVIGDLEGRLSSTFGYDKINYLMLMMVDPDVHFHVIPRYESAPVFNDTEFPDHGWPGPPQLTSWTEVSEPDAAAIRQALISTG